MTEEKRAIRLPDKIKEKAFELYLEGMSYEKISEEIEKEFSIVCKPSSIANWASDGGWFQIKNDTKENVYEIITKEKTNELAQIMRSHLEAYEKIREKGQKELDLLPFESAEGAARAVDIAIQGYKKVASGMIQTKFIEGVLTVLMEEIEDERTLKRIQIKLQKIAEESIK